jgi:hypothetical protein
MEHWRPIDWALAMAYVIAFFVLTIDLFIWRP